MDCDYIPTPLPYANKKVGMTHKLANKQYVKKKYLLVNS